MVSFNLKNTKFWLDITLLGLIWILALVVPAEYTILELISWATLLKIMALLATIEVVGFFALFFLDERSSIMVQGFFGGFVSSTATFLHFTQQDEFKSNHPRSVSRALLLSTVAMLIEGLFFILTINPHNALQLSRPFLVQLIILLLMVILLKSQKFPEQQSGDNKMKLKEMIIWRNVVKFSLFLITLIYGMRFLSDNLSIPPIWSSFLLSLFEAHGVLVAAITEYGRPEDQTTVQGIIMAILIGNVLSKTFFILRGKNKTIRGPVLFSLYLSLILALTSNFI